MTEDVVMWAFWFGVSAFAFEKWGPRIMSGAALTEVEERHSREAIEAEIVRFEERARQLQSGAITAEQFRPFRLKHGTYGQRQPGFQMLPVKIAAVAVNLALLR